MVDPAYVTLIQLGTGLAVVLAVIVALRSARETAAGRAGVPEAVGVTLLAWLAATAALALAGVYRASPDVATPTLPIAVLIGLGGAWIAATTIPSLRALIDQPAMQPSLVALQVWRVVGVVFLILLSRGQLPALFALPAGLGDIATGLAAPFVARRLHGPAGRSSAIIWNMFGLLDLIVAIGLGATINPGPVQLFHITPSAVLMTEFPMALIPTFLVPLSMALHLLSLRYLLRPSTASAGAVVAPRHLDPGR
jgi:hypothetical protein